MKKTSSVWRRMLSAFGPAALIIVGAAVFDFSTGSMWGSVLAPLAVIMLINKA